MKRRAITLIFLLLGCSLALQAERDTLRIYFDEGSNEVSGFQYSLMKIFTQTHFATGELIVAAHTDNVGDTETNLRFSRARAKTVAALLLDLGIQPQQLLVEAWGQAAPSQPNNSAYNRARNRRVDLIGIPNPSATEDLRGVARQTIILDNGTPVAYREMTTQDGRPKRVYVINLERDDVPLLGFGSGAWVQTGQSPTPVITCQGTETFWLQIPVSSNLRCPLTSISFKDVVYDRTKKAADQQLDFIAPQPVDSGYAILVGLPDRRYCASSDYTILPGCHTEQSARIKVSDIKVKSMLGIIRGTNEKLRPKANAQGDFDVHFVNEQPSSLKLDMVVTKRGRRSQQLKNVPLDALRLNATTGDFELNKRVLRQLKKAGY